MIKQGQKILAEALKLSPIERAAWVEEPLSSFTFPVRQEIDPLWAKEVEDRIDAYERGELRASPAEAVFSGLDRDQAR